MFPWGRFAASSLAALLIGLLLATVTAGWLRSAAPGGDLLWQRMPLETVAVWMHVGSHGVPLEVEAGVGIEASEAERLQDRLGGLLERPPPLPRVDVRFGILLVSLTLLFVPLAFLASAARSADVSTPGDVVAGSVLSGAVYGAGLGVLGWASKASLHVTAGPVSSGIAAGPQWVWAAALGFVWAAVAVALGAGLRPELRKAVSSELRLHLSIWARGARAGTLAATAGLVIWSLARVLGGRETVIEPSLVALGGFTLGGNAVASALVGSHGPVLGIGAGAGPFEGWAGLGYLSYGASGDTASWGWWLFLLVPAAAALGAARAGAFSRVLSPGRRAVGFGIAWGLTLAALAMLLRVRISADLSIFALSGVGTIAIDPAAAFLAGGLWGGLGCYAWTRLLEARPADDG